MADMFKEEREVSSREIGEMVKEMKMMISQMEEGLITYTEMTNQLVERCYKINQKCASLGAMCMHWKVG
jgi:hypothetical protein